MLSEFDKEWLDKVGLPIDKLKKLRYKLKNHSLPEFEDEEIHYMLLCLPEVANED